MTGVWRSAKEAWARARLAGTPEAARWLKVRQQEAALRDAWGLGDEEKGKGYRERLRRLCDFLGELEPQPGAAAPDDKDFDRLYRGLERAPIGTKEREDYLSRLEALARALAALVDSPPGGDYLQRWQAWSQQPALWAGQHRADLERALRTVGALPILGSPTQSAQVSLLALGKLVDELPCLPAAVGSTDAARTRLRWCLEELAGDHEWAHLQVLVRLARECLREKAFSPACRHHAQMAKEALSKAIPRLEKQLSNQPSAEGLYGLLAAACLVLGKPDDLPRKQRQKQIERALVYARRAVEIAPESIRERLVLLDVLSSLGDPEDIRVQAEIALNLDSGPDTLRTIGDSYWGRTVALRGRGARRNLLREATGFFAKALENVESATVDESCPVEQMQAHGWAHFWMGRFQSELGRYVEAAAHLRTACSLGFKPLEAQVELGWTCFLARQRKDADKAFREALAESRRQRAGDAKVAEAPGEERPIDDLAFEGTLGWAFLCAEFDPTQALRYADQAKRRLVKTTNPEDPELLAALLEVRGRISLRKHDISKGIKQLEDAVLLSPRSGAYCALGFAYLSQSRAVDPVAPPDILRQAREAYRLGRQSDIRGRYRGELWDLNRELRKSEGSAAAASALKSGAPSAGSAAPTASPASLPASLLPGPKG